MEYRYLGKSGLQLSVMSFGSWVSFNQQIDDAMADELMGIAYDNGINFFDNAETYANGESEKMMGRVLKNKNWDRSSYLVSSKVFYGRYGKDFKPNQNGLSRKHIMEACHEALERLQVNYLDLYYCHRPDPNTPMYEVVWAMNTLLQQGKILYWGTSEWSGVEIMEAHKVAERYNLLGPVTEQPQYNLFERFKVETDYEKLYETVGLGTTIWSPLASGLLTGKYNNGIPEDSRLARKDMAWLSERWIEDDKINKVKALAEVAKDLGVTTASLSIAWSIKNPHVTTAILGATKKQQLLDNLKALDVMEQLTPDVMERINEVMK
ncbi:MAG: aldo/keto reductase [Ginsengibacter sp.]